jgi:DNA-binding response OmpR family regulator
MPEDARILIVEDEAPMRTALADTLGDVGYRVMTAADGNEGLQRALAESPDLLLLDVMMPGRSGFSVCQELRKAGKTLPVLMLTAKGQVKDRVTGLDAGADDYLVKPFSTRELLARVRALLRRSHPESNHAVKSLELGDVTINFTHQTATRGDENLALTAKEFAVLHLLASRVGEPVTREEFLDHVWGYAAYPTTRTVDNHIAMLRSKFGKGCIETVHGTGYRLKK